MEKGLSKKSEKREARAMPGPDTKPWRHRPTPRDLDEVHLLPSTADGSDSFSDAARPVPAAITPSTAPVDVPSRTPERGKAQFVWRPSAQVPPASPKESFKNLSPVTKKLKAQSFHRAPIPLPDPRVLSTISEEVKVTTSSVRPRSSKATTREFPNRFIYQPTAPRSPASSSPPATQSAFSTPPKAQSGPSVSTSVKLLTSRSQFVDRPQVQPNQPSKFSASPAPSPVTVSRLEVRKVRIRCSKCGSTSHLWKECPDDGKCALCMDPESEQPCTTVVMWTRMMKSCRDSGDLPQMRNLLSSLKSDGHKPTVHSYSLLLSLLVSKGQMQEAQKVWKSMEEDSVVADTICYNTLLNGWCSTGKLEEAKAVLKEMKEMQFQLTTSTYNTLIKGYGLAGLSAEAMKLLQQMTSEGIAKPNKQTYNILINAWAKVKDVEQARRVLQLMRNAGFSPDVVTYNTIAKAYAELRRSYEAERVINEMQDAYIRPNERTYGIVINSYCETRRPEEGIALLDRMRMDGVRCNLAIYNILIKGFAELHQHENVDKVLGLMKASGVRPDVQSFSLVMNVWCSSGLVEEARTIFERMQKFYELRPDVMAYTILAKGYVRARRPAEAECLLSEMRSQGLKPNVFTYTTVISGWCNVGNMEDAFRIFMDMQTCGVRPNSNTVNTLIWGFSESKQPQKAEEVLETLKQTGFKPDLKCLELVAEAWRSVGLPAEARRVLRGEGACEVNDTISEISMRTRFDSMIARRELDLDSNIHKKLRIEPESAKTRSSGSPSQIAINSRITPRVIFVASKTRCPAITGPRALIDPKSRTRAFKVCDKFVQTIGGLKCAASAPLGLQCRITCRAQAEVRGINSAFPARIPWTRAFII